ncbi:hypothetical protein V5O48_006409 [Marasmius crinis-equi]|uniref:Uncharacterized protein n=1 Tax=Marasmius crinis-equi TaxID=585013 RepID=A0ABR3FJS6_9AGAR
MHHGSSSHRGAASAKNRRLPSSSSIAGSSKLTAISRLGHLPAFSDAVTSVAGGQETPYTNTPPHSPQTRASTSRGITRQRPIEVNSRPSLRSPRTPVQGEYVTYHTNDLGLFEGQTSDPLFGQAPPTLSNLVQPTEDATTSQPLQLEGYTYTGGWTINENGQHVYVPMGNIREIPDEEDEDDFLEVEAIINDSMTSPPMLPPDTTPPPRPQAGMCFLPPSVILTQSGWPPASPPPQPSTVPRPQPRPLPFSNTSNSIRRSLPQSSRGPPSVSSSESEEDFDDGPPPISPFNMPGPGSHAYYGFAEFLREEPIVTQNLQSIKRLCDNFKFLAASRDDEGSCKLLIKSLLHVKESLTRGLLIPNDLWKFLSHSKRVNFRNRLLSLRRTLTRLERVATHLTFLRSERLVVIVDKLGDHHKKLSDIASKCDATFDFLDLCGLHEVANVSKRNSSAEHYLKARESYLRKKASKATRS